MRPSTRYTDDALAAAIRSSRSWRGVLRCLGLKATSAGSFRAARRRADVLGLDYSHFTGQRRWTDRELAEAVTTARSWPEVLQRLGLATADGNLRTVRVHANRLAVDAFHLDAPRIRPVSASPFSSAPDPKFLRTGGAMLAAAWFMLRGYHVLWPLEPCRYDLAVRTSGSFQRVQVKTATYQNDGTYIAHLSNSRRVGRLLYDVDEIDCFLVIDAELNAYLVPFTDVAGYSQISLRSYGSYLVGEAGNWLRQPAQHREAS